MKEEMELEVMFLCPATDIHDDNLLNKHTKRNYVCSRRICLILNTYSRDICINDV